MIGPPALVVWIAQVVFWAVLALGLVTDSLSLRSAGLFVLLWLVGFSVIPRLSSSSGLFATPYMAVIDIALVLVVFKGDVPLS